jgi:hypothetical protein
MCSRTSNSSTYIKASNELYSKLINMTQVAQSNDELTIIDQDKQHRQTKPTFSQLKVHK